MADSPRYFLTTAIDYPNSRPHIGTAFEKIGADVQARYRRMEGYDVFFLMGNDENTVKVSKRAAELGLDPKAYCDDMARQFKEVWRALDISFDDFIQTSEPRHHAGCRKFIQKVYDNGYIYKGQLRGLVLRGLRGVQDRHRDPGSRRRLSHPQDAARHAAASRAISSRCRSSRNGCWTFYAAESRLHPAGKSPQRGRELSCRPSLKDVNITRAGEAWGIRVPFDAEFTIYVWFDALLNYITGDRLRRRRGALRQLVAGRHARHRQGHHALPLRPVAGDVLRRRHRAAAAACSATASSTSRTTRPATRRRSANRSATSSSRWRSSRSSAREAFRYYFLRECPFPGDGEFSWKRFEERVQRRPGEQPRQPLQPRRHGSSARTTTAGWRAPPAWSRASSTPRSTPRRRRSRCRRTSRRASTTRRCR